MKKERFKLIKPPRPLVLILKPFRQGHSFLFRVRYRLIQ